MQREFFFVWFVLKICKNFLKQYMYVQIFLMIVSHCVCELNCCIVLNEVNCNIRNKQNTYIYIFVRCFIPTVIL